MAETNMPGESGAETSTSVSGEYDERANAAGEADAEATAAEEPGAGTTAAAAATEPQVPFPAPGLETVCTYLTSVRAWYLATSVDGQPHVRPFSFAQVADGRLWFCTATTKDVYAELRENPRFELTAWKPGHGWIVLRGRADFSAEARHEVREAAWRHLKSIGEPHDGPDDPELAPFTCTDVEAWVCDIDGSWVPLEV